MTGLRTLLALCLLAAAATQAPCDTPAVVSDVQVLQPESDRYQIVIRSTAAQAFDATGGGRGRRVAVRLHQATLGKLATPTRGTFGRLKLRARRDGDVVVRVRLRRGWRANVQQGGSPNVVVLHLER